MYYFFWINIDRVPKVNAPHRGPKDRAPHSPDKKKHSTSEKNKMESTKIVSNKCHRIWNPDSITEGNKHSTLILANVNRQANTVKDLKQKPKKNKGFQPREITTCKRMYLLRKIMKGNYHYVGKTKRTHSQKESERFCKTQVDQTRN